MTDKETLISGLREAIQKYKAVLSDKSGEEKDEMLCVIGQAEIIADSLELGEIERTKLSIYTFSRQATDSYHPQPPEFLALSSSITHVKKYIFQAA